MTKKKDSLHPMEKKLLDHWGDLDTFFGVRRTSLLAMSLLALRDHPLTIDEMSRLLHISRSSLSRCLREAQQVGAVRSLHLHGSRKASYELPWTNHNGYHGLDWLAWRALRRLTMLINPTIKLLQEALDLDPKERFFTPLVRERMVGVLDTFRKQRIVLCGFLELEDERRDELLNRLVAWTEELIYKAA